MTVDRLEITANPTTLPMVLREGLQVQHDWVHRHAPALEMVASALDKYGNGVVTVVESCAKVSRQTLRYGQRTIEQELNQMYEVGGRFASTLPEADRKTILDEIFAEEVGAQNNLMYNTWTRLVLNDAKLHETVRDQSYETAPVIDDELQADPELNYDFLKFMAAEIDYDEQDDRLVAGLGAVLFTEAVMKGERNIPGRLLRELQQGVFDSAMHQEVLQAVAEGEPTVFVAHARLWKLMETMIPDMPTAERIERLLHHADYLPSDVQAEVAVLRASMLGRLNEFVRDATKNIRDAGFYPLEDDMETEFRKAVRAAFGTMARSSLAQFNTKAELMQARVRSKRGRSQRQAGRQAVGSVFETIPEQEALREPMELCVVSPDGELHGPDSDRFQRLIADYLAQHRGVPTLETDLSHILDYLSRIDMSHGQVKGVKKYTGTTKIADVERSVYAFKPQDAVGLSTGSIFGKKLRVLFSIVNNHIELHALTDRDKLPVAARSLGIISSTYA